MKAVSILLLCAGAAWSQLPKDPKPIIDEAAIKAEAAKENPVSIHRVKMKGMIVDNKQVWTDTKMQQITVGDTAKIAAIKKMNITSLSVAITKPVKPKPVDEGILDKILDFIIK